MRSVPSLYRWSAVVTFSAAIVLHPIQTITPRVAVAQGASHGQGNEHRADPCLRLEALPPQAQADDQQCLALGGSSGVAKGDFDGDGVADLAIGTPDEGLQVTRFINGSQQLVTLAAAGTVTIIYGTAANGLSATTGRSPLLIHQDLANVLGDVEANDRFGAALASGDFNGDTFSDLAVSVPGDNAVHVFKGSATGLNAADDSQIFGTDFVDNQGLALNLQPGLTWGDFNGDTFGDLAIEATEFEGIGVRANVVVLYGSQQFGLQFVGLDIFSFNNGGQAGDSGFGTVAMTLAAGDFSGDGADDLAVGLPLADVVDANGFTVLDGGTVTILQGVVGVVPAGGLSTAGATGLTELNANFLPQTNEQFGTALGVGDFDGDGADDLAVGTPREDVPAGAGSSLLATDGGFVAVFSHATTLHGLYTQLPFALAPQNFDNFGAALIAADLNGDGAEDLAIGTPGDRVGTVAGAGSVTVLFGIFGVGLPRPASAGLPQITGTAATFTQNTANIADTAESADHFGATLTAWNFGKTTHADLVIGVPDEDIVVAVGGNLSGITTENRANAGLLHVLYGSATGLQTSGSQAFTQNSSGVPDSVEAGDRFGSAIY